ncbi:MAG: hypothetical protein QOD81_31 [Solirubrobacteraceae bacterium]|jgi:hypothetical protein|nr:hypothetical protein [Solirubrobacteraceae bacterium]
MTGAGPDPQGPRGAPPPRRPLLVLTIASFIIGAGVMLAFEAPVARAIGVTALFAFIVAGVFTIADPDWLGHEDE